jgi:uncharacterized membrane protein YdjX (TVP38/TMEM64 family)
MAWLFLSGSYRHLHAEAMRDGLLSLGPLGPLAFVLAFTLVQPLGPSGHLFVLAASVVWAGPQAFALSLLGGVLGQSAFFLFYRYALYDWARARIPARLHRFDTALEQRPFRAVLVMRLLTFTWPVVPAVLAVSKVRFWPMLLATALGLVPMIAFDVWAGERLSAYLFG